MSKAKDQCKIFHILECELWLQQNGQFTTAQPVVDGFEMYADLSVRFPPLPHRYSSLVLPDDWYLKKSAFKQLPDDAMASIRKGWKDIRGEIRLYASAVALIIMNRRREISRLQPTQVQARRANVPASFCKSEGQQRMTPGNMMAGAHYQAQSDSLSDSNCNRFSVRDELNRLSAIVAATFANALDAQEPPAIGDEFVPFQPMQQVASNLDLEPDIRAIFDREWENLLAWSDVMNKEMLDVVNVTDDEILEYYHSVN